MSKPKGITVSKKNLEKVKIRKEKTLEKKRFSRTNLVREADRVASLFVRERDK